MNSGQLMTAAVTNLVIFILINQYLLLPSCLKFLFFKPLCHPFMVLQGMASSHSRRAMSETFCKFAEIPPKTFSMSFCERFQLAFTLGVPRSICISVDETWWSNSESRMLQDDGSQALLLNPHCQTWRPRCPFAGRVYWWADAHDTCSRKQARTFRSPAWFASDVDAWSTNRLSGSDWAVTKTRRERCQRPKNWAKEHVVSGSRATSGLDDLQRVRRIRFTSIYHAMLCKWFHRSQEQLNGLIKELPAQLSPLVNEARCVEVTQGGSWSSRSRGCSTGQGDAGDLQDLLGRARRFGTVSWMKSR